MDEIRMNLLKEVADLDALPVGAYNIRENGKAAGRNTTANIDIVTKQDKPYACFGVVFKIVVKPRMLFADVAEIIFTIFDDHVAEIIVS